MKLFFYPIYALANGWNGPVFNTAALPRRIYDNIYLEDISGILSESTFRPTPREFSRSDVTTLSSVRHALVSRVEEPLIETTQDAHLDHDREQDLERVMACLRLLRPLREELGPVRGVIDSTGNFEVKSFSKPYSQANLSEIEKLAGIREQDVEHLVELAPQMLAGMRGEFWKFRMAVHFHTDGFFSGHNWKTRFFYRCTALEALFSSKHKTRRGSDYSKARIRKFLGSDTQLYETGDIPDHLPQAENITVAAVLDPLYEARNTIAHGDRLKDDFFTEEWRMGINGPLKKREVLDEAVCALVRRSALKILTEGLLESFRSSVSADSYFQEVDAETYASRNLRRPRHRVDISED